MSTLEPRGQNKQQQATEQRDPELPIQRIVIALDATRQSMQAVEAAVRIAQQLGVEIVGVFVEDVNLLRLSELPFIEEIGSYASSRRPLQALQLERQLRSQAAALQRLLRTVAERHQVPWSFQVLRGPIASELRKAAATTDLFIIGRSRKTSRGRALLGSTTRLLIVEAPRLTLILHHKPSLQPPLLLVYDGSAAAQRALRLATRLTEVKEAPLMVVLMGEAADSGDELRQAVASWLHERGLRASYQWLARPNIARLFHIVMDAKGGAVFLPSDGLTPRDASLLELLEELQCPVFLVQ